MKPDDIDKPKDNYFDKPWYIMSSNAKNLPTHNADSCEIICDENTKDVTVISSNIYGIHIDQKANELAPKWGHKLIFWKKYRYLRDFARVENHRKMMEVSILIFTGIYMEMIIDYKVR
jgi:hypothetical protein